MELSALTAISPVDGRYQNKTDALRSIFSEYGFFRFRIAVEIEWLKSLSNHADIKDLDTFTADSISFLDDIKIKRHKFLSIIPLSHAYEHTGGFLLPLLVGGEIFFSNN